MKNKLILISCIILLNAISVKAQSNRKDLFRLGVRGGFNIASLKLKGDNLPTTKSLSGYNFGAVIETGIVPLVNLQGGLLYSRKGGKFTTSASKTEFRLNYLEIPVIIRLKPKINDKLKIYFGAGGYFATGLSGEVENTTAGITTTDDVKFGKSDDEISTSDLGLAFQSGIELGRNLNFEFTYHLGTKNILNGSGTEMYNRTFSINIVYYLFQIRGPEKVSKKTKEKILKEG